MGNSNDKENIMFIIPNMIGGGAQKTVANLTLYLGGFFDIHIVTFYETKDACEYIGTHYFIPKNSQKTSFFSRKIAYLEQIYNIKALKRQLGVTCAISFLPEADILNVLSRNNEKVIISIRNNLSESDYLIGITRKVYKWCLKKADKIVSITNGVKSEMIKSFSIANEKIITIYNPIDVRIEEELHNNNGNTISTMGRLEEQKGQWHLVRAFAKVVAQKPDAKLIIIGEGSLEAYLKDLTRKLNIWNNVVFTGFIKNPYNYIKKSSAFVFPSLYEGLGNALLEVMQLGVPIISSDCDYGPRELISPNDSLKRTKLLAADYSAPYGILVPVCDDVLYSAEVPLTSEEQILADTILNVLNDVKLQMKYRKSAYIRTKDFSLNTIGEKWKSIIES